MSTADFSSLKLKPGLLSNLNSLKFEKMTDIQAQSLPSIIAGEDIIAQAKTGSGKTAAFGLGVLQKLNVKQFRIQSIVLCPTRELADQVAKDIRQLARGIHNIKVLTLCGGMPFGPQLGSLEHGAHIIVGTPGRIEDHLGKGTLDLSFVDTLVLDEADRMLDMGFENVLDYIVSQMPKKRQTLLFSATYPPQIQAMSKNIMRKPLMVKSKEGHDETSIEQQFYKVDSEQQRLEALHILLMHYEPESALVFCNTKKEVQQVADNLVQFGFDALALHGDLEQRDRDQTLVRFANKSASVLVATDVAARGLDIDSLQAVINYQIAHDPEVHVHRVGRTGRAGNKGLACSLFSERENHRVAILELDTDPLVDSLPLPSLNLLDKSPTRALMTTLMLDGGKKQKVRPGDILGALTNDQRIIGKQIGKINVYDNRAYVAVETSVAKVALNKISNEKLKGRNFRARIIR